MRYALLGDVHSSLHDLQAVLAHIQEVAPDAMLIGTGDLFECTISKRFMHDKKYTKLSDVMELPEHFTELIAFPSVVGNQEERILYMTETDDPLCGFLSAMPEKLTIGEAEVIHGHQWKWGGQPWSLLQAEVQAPVTFYGHSHTSGFIKNGVHEPAVEFSVPYPVEEGQILINVGAVTGDREWVLYDQEASEVTFMKAP